MCLVWSSEFFYVLQQACRKAEFTLSFPWDSLPPPSPYGADHASVRAAVSVGVGVW